MCGFVPFSQVSYTGFNSYCFWWWKLVKLIMCRC